MNNVTNNSTGFPWIEVTLILIGLVAGFLFSELHGFFQRKRETKKPVAHEVIEVINGQSPVCAVHNFIGKKQLDTTKTPQLVSWLI